MSRKLSLTQSAQSVQHVLTGYSHAQSFEGGFHGLKGWIDLKRLAEVSDGLLFIALLLVGVAPVPIGDGSVFLAFVYFDGDDLQSAFNRLGTTMLDAVVSDAIFSDRERLHRDVLADATTQFLDELLRGSSTTV